MNKVRIENGIKTTVIGIGELDVVRAPDRITTLGLGSCCGVVMYDKASKIGGMIHVMLPTASKATEGTLNKGKFADAGILMLLDLMIKNGARRSALTAKLAGGASMFSGGGMQSDLLKVGERNVTVCKDMLRKLNIPLVSQDVLGNCGRTIIFDPATGVLHIKTVGKGERDI